MSTVTIRELLRAERVDYRPFDKGDRKWAADQKLPVCLAVYIVLLSVSGWLVG